MPMRHQNDVTKERARLLYDTMHHNYGANNAIRIYNVDVSMVIQESIELPLRGGTMGGLLHRFLITDLCRKAGVQWHASEQVQQPMTIIDHLTIEKY